MVSYKNLIIILMVAACVFKFFNFPAWYGFDWDQEKGAMIVKTILIDHKPALLGLEASQGGMFIGSLFYYFVAIFYWIGKMNPMYGIIVNIFFAGASLLSLGYVGNKLFNKNTGILAVIFYGFSSYLTAFDRTLWNPTPIFFLCLWGFYFLYQYLKERKYLHLILTTACFAFLFNSHTTVLFVMTFLGLSLLLFGGKKFWLNYKSLIIVGLVTTLMLSTLIIFDSRHDLWNLKHLIAYLFSSGGKSSGLLAESPVVNAFLSYFAFLGNIFVANLQRIFYVVVVLFLFALEFMRIKKTKNKLLFNLVVLFTAMSFFPFLINKSAFLPYYLLFYFPVFIFLISDLLGTFRAWPVFALVFVLANLPLLWTSSTGLALQYKQQAVKYVVDDAKGQPYKVDFITALGRKTGFNYLFWLYDPKRGLVEGNDGPLVYKMVVPDSMVNQYELTAKFGSIGVIKKPSSVLLGNPASKVY